MNDETTSQSDLLLQAWWDRLARYRETFIRPGLAWYETAAAALEGKPPGAAHNANLFRTADGRVWARGFDSFSHPTYRELVRGPRGTPGWEPYVESPARLTSEELAARGPVTQSSDVMAEAWGWVHPDPHGMRGSGTAITRGLDEQREALAWTFALEARRAAVDSWIRERAARRAPNDHLSDERGFLLAWHAGYLHDLPDPSSLAATLSRILDQMSPGILPRDYWT